MQGKENKPKNAKLAKWIKKQTAEGVEAIHKLDVINGLVTEAKASWILPYQMLIGKLRPQGLNSEFIWFIYGDIKTDYIDGKVADNPRDVARHFAMKWQLEAARSNDPSDTQTEQISNDTVQNPNSKQLAFQAEALYELTEDDRAWAS